MQPSLPLSQIFVLIHTQHVRGCQYVLFAAYTPQDSALSKLTAIAQYDFINLTTSFTSGGPFVQNPSSENFTARSTSPVELDKQ